MKAIFNNLGKVYWHFIYLIKTERKEPNYTDLSG